MLRGLRRCSGIPLFYPQNTHRYLVTASKISNVKSFPPSNSRPQNSQLVREPHQESWLTRQVRASPVALKVFMGVAKLLGYGTPRQMAGRRTFRIYEQVCVVRADEDSTFWREACHLPPTFQSWFTITNLHVWLLTVRFRALPPSYGDAYIQGLIDHFFIDVEDRIRAVLQPDSGPNAPYTLASQFYTNPNAPVAGSPTKKHGRAPDRLVTRQMNIFKEQWTGMGMAFDLGLVKDDMEMAGAVWRNLLGARGAQGITFESPLPPKSPTSTTTTTTTTTPNSTPEPAPSPFRRSINLVGGLVENPAKIDERGLDTEEARDDYSGVHDFPPHEADKYIVYPEVMVDVVAYVRRELARLERVPDEEIIRGDLKVLKFGSVRGR